MSTTSSQKNLSASVPDAVSNHHTIGQFSFCRHCGDPAGFFSPAWIYPYFPDEPLICQTCGRQDYDVSGFCIVRNADNHIVSPHFPTKGEAKLFGQIFGATRETGFSIWQYDAFFSAESCDVEGRKDWLNDLSVGRAIYDRLLALPDSPGDGLLRVLSEQYGLPLFKDDHCGRTA